MNSIIRSILFFILIHSKVEFIVSQSHLDTATIKKELLTILERDQKTRSGSDSIEFIRCIDSINLIQIENIIQKYGWLGKNVVGESANRTLFLVIQHAELPVQEKYLPLLQKSVAAGESSQIDLAYLEDRILMRQGKKQRYGTQVIFNEMGEQVFHPIEDEKNVNIRRQQVGMGPLEEYATHFGINYKIPH